MAEKELVLEVGVEGGGATVFRTPVGPGVWQFHLEGTCMDLDENDDEVWRPWQSQPVPNIEDAVRSISKDGNWVFYYPLSIHSDYRSAIWKLVQGTVGNLQDEQKTMWNERRRDVWFKLCQQEQ